MTVKFISVPTKRLAETINGSAYTFELNNIKGWSGTNLTASDFGTEHYISFRNTAGTKLELMKIDPATIASSQITILKRGLGFDGDQVTEVTANIQDVWVKGDTLVELGTHASQLLEETVRKSGNQTIAGVKTFTEIPQTAGIATGANDIMNYATALSMLTGSTSVNRIQVAGTAGENLTAGNLVYLKLADGLWWKCDADTAATVENIILGIAQATTTSGNSISGGVLLQGLDTNQTGLTDKTTYYASNTAGGISSTPGTSEVTLGVSRSTSSLLFIPRYNQQLTEDQQDALAGTSGTPGASNKFVTDADTATSSSASKIVRVGAGGKIDSSFIQSFAGDGSDGALTSTSGVTNIDLGAAAVVIKNYTSVSITGTGQITCSNPHANGTILILKSQGGVTMTSSTIPNFDMSGMGGAGGAGGAVSTAGTSQQNTAGTDATIVNNYQDSTSSSVGKGAPAASASGATASSAFSNQYVYTLTELGLTNRKITIAPGNGGGGGSGGQSQTSTGSAGGAGGRGGGALVIQCGGALNFTSTLGISVAGKNGTTAGNSSGSTQNGAGGGGGGGGAGMCLVLYNTLTAATGTINAAGGTGGAGGNSNCSGGGGGSACGGGGGGSGGASFIAAGGAGGAAGTPIGSNVNGNAGSAGSAGSGGGGGGGSQVSTGLAASATGGAGGAAGATSTSLWYITKNNYFA